MSWNCARCHQLNAEWCNDCGRCQLGREEKFLVVFVELTHSVDESIVDAVYKAMTDKPRTHSCTADPKLYIRDVVRLYLAALRAR